MQFIQFRTVSGEIVVLNTNHISKILSCSEDQEVCELILANGLESLKVSFSQSEILIALKSDRKVFTIQDFIDRRSNKGADYNRLAQAAYR